MFTRKQIVRSAAHCTLAAGKVVSGQVVCDAMSSAADFPEMTVRSHQKMGRGPQKADGQRD